MVFVEISSAAARDNVHNNKNKHVYITYMLKIDIDNVD